MLLATIEKNLKYSFQVTVIVKKLP